jgi:uncharacterized protein YjbJ (UPF0337 family)
VGIPNKEEVRGKLRGWQGAVKEKIGHVIDDKAMERQGAAERAAGDIRNQVGKIKRRVGDTIKDVGKFVRK